MSNPASFMSLPSKLDLKSVVMAIPAISTARASSPCSRTKSSDASTAAALPSEVGQHCSLVSGS